MSTIITTLGSTIRTDLVFADQGNPVDLTGADLSIGETNRTALAAATLTVVDPPAGVFRLFLAHAKAGELPLGKVSWFRVVARRPGRECPVVTPKIWVTVV
jgi:hypothetical protein